MREGTRYCEPGRVPTILFTHGTDFSIWTICSYMCPGSRNILILLSETQPMFHTIFEDSLVMVLVNEMMNIFFYLSILGIYYTLVLLVYSNYPASTNPIVCLNFDNRRRNFVATNKLHARLQWRNAMHVLHQCGEQEIHRHCTQLCQLFCSSYMCRLRKIQTPQRCTKSQDCIGLV